MGRFRVFEKAAHQPDLPLPMANGTFDVPLELAEKCITLFAKDCIIILGQFLQNGLKAVQVTAGV